MTKETAAEARRAWGARLRDVRLDKGLTQVELARLAGIDQASVSRVESGSNSSFDTMLRVAKALGVSLEVPA